MAPADWKRYDREDKANTTPETDTLVWIVEELYEEGVSLGYFDGFTFRTWQGSDDCSVSYWTPVEYPDLPDDWRGDGDAERS